MEHLDREHLRATITRAIHDGLKDLVGAMKGVTLEAATASLASLTHVGPVAEADAKAIVANLVKANTALENKLAYTQRQLQSAMDELVAERRKPKGSEGEAELVADLTNSNWQLEKNLATVRQKYDNAAETLQNKVDYLIKVEKQLETCEHVNSNLHDQVHGLELELDRQKERNETLAKANGRLSAAGCDASEQHRVMTARIKELEGANNGLGESNSYQKGLIEERDTLIATLDSTLYGLRRKAETVDHLSEEVEKLEERNQDLLQERNAAQHDRRVRDERIAELCRRLDEYEMADRQAHREKPLGPLPIQTADCDADAARRFGGGV